MAATFISKEEENYVRMALMLTGLSPRAVRVLFDKELPPASLQSTLNLEKNRTLDRLKQKRVINQAQWDLMFPLAGGADSKTFDVTLMICLIRNLTHLIPPATGFDHLPSAGYTTPGSDLARIKYYRNYLAHLDESKIDNTFFTSAWNDVSDAVGRLGGTGIYKECQDLQTKILDQSKHDIMLEIQNCMGEVTDLKKTVQNLKSVQQSVTQDMKVVKSSVKTNYEQNTKELLMLKSSVEKKTQEIEELIRGHTQKGQEIEKLGVKEMETLKANHEQMRKETEILKTDLEIKAKEIEKLHETVPWNIREQMTKKIENWKEDDQMFVETLGASHVLKCIKTNSCVTVTGSSGVGKTFTVRHVALQMADDGYDILPVTNPEDIVKYHNTKKKTIYVIDDLCGTYTLNRTYVDKWKTMHEDITRLLENEGTKIIASCRLQVYQDEQFKLLPLFIACECNLLSKNIILSAEEKQLMAERYLKSDAYKIRFYYHLYDFFPLICRLYRENQISNVEEFFKNPFSVFETEIENLKTDKGYGKYCALALCVMFNNHLKEEWLTDDVNQDIKQIIKNTCEACKLNRGTSRLVLKDELDSLIHTLLKKEQGCYSTIHDKIFDFLSFYFGNTEMIHCIIKNGNTRLISERFLFKKKDDRDQFTTIVPDKYQKMYIERMLDDWSKGEIVTVFTNNNMKSPEFRSKLLLHLKNLDITYQQHLATRYDNLSSISDYTESIQKLYETFSDDNVSEISDNNIDRISYALAKKHVFTLTTYVNAPLLICCYLGDTDLVEWCCSCGADVNYFRKWGESPLYIACRLGYTDIVTNLVNYKAHINQCSININLESPLYIACEKGHTDIVTILVDNKADINFRTISKVSPLYAACERGYTDIVNKLVDHKADLNKCTWGESPLYIACKKGHTNIVTKLVENNADINKCTGSGVSPLYAACERGYTDIVTKLVDNKADINKCTGSGASPLHAACERGYTDIVTKLVDNKADINMCTWNGESPLYRVCKEGYKNIVTKLVENNADINKCTGWEESPLYIACNGGYTDIVTKLLDYKADINKRTCKGESPLYIACKKGFTDIVTRLLDKKADINQCTGWKNSASDIACKEGYTEIMSKMVTNQADINTCTRCDESPLYIARNGEYTDIVNMLAYYKAKNKCTWKGESPLYIACKGGYSDIVTKLVDNKADINKCTEYGGSPLYIACQRGYTIIVTKLVDNQADINKCTTSGESPLYAACDLGYIDIVTKLIDNKAEINQCTCIGESPLYAACKGGYTDIVAKLVDNKADVNKCTCIGESPLHAACKGGYTDMVAKLVDNNKEDVNKCTGSGLSPQYAACEREYTDTVTKLVDNITDINKCKYTDSEVSPPYAACESVYTDKEIKLVDNLKVITPALDTACKKAYTGIITKRLNNKSDILRYRFYEKSPLHIACERNYSDIVTKLVDSMADINKCTNDGESPLYIACKGGFIQIVETLLARGANHTNCDKNGQSPLDIARLIGHDHIEDCITKHSFLQ